MGDSPKENRWSEEDIFRKEFSINAGRMLKGLFYYKNEVCLYAPSSLLSRDFYSFENIKKERKEKYIGRIDLLFNYKEILYCGEIKYQPFAGSDFWDALKIIGYTSYYKWQQECFGEEIYPKSAIFMPFKRIKMEHKILAGRLGIIIFGIEKTEEGYKVIPVNL